MARNSGVTKVAGWRLEMTAMRKSFLLFCVLGTGFIAGCATVALDRSKVEPLKTVEFVRVETPPLHVLTFMQALVNSPAVGAGLIPAAIAESQGNTLISPPAIPDLGVLVSDGLRSRLPRQAAWWPRMMEGPGTVPKAYVHPKGHWLRVEVEKLEIAPPPFRTVFAVVDISLRTQSNQAVWVERKAFSGVVHGGEKIEVDRIPGDLTQLRREIERAAQWLVNEIAGSVR